MGLTSSARCRGPLTRLDVLLRGQPLLGGMGAWEEGVSQKQTWQEEARPGYRQGLQSTLEFPCPRKGWNASRLIRGEVSS